MSSMAIVVNKQKWMVRTKILGKRASIESAQDEK